MSFILLLLYELYRLYELLTFVQYCTEKHENARGKLL